MAKRFQPQSNDELCHAVRNYCWYHDRRHGPIGTWDTSLIKNMAGLFLTCCTTFNESISDWDTSSVTTMSCMFAGCTSFDQPLHTWNTSSVTNMESMFEDCSSFNQPLHMWDTSSVTNMESMFWNCTSFHQPLGNWHAPLSVFAGCPDPEYCSAVIHDYYWVK